MLRRVRETAPGALVPLAWAFAVAAHRGALSRRTVVIAHLVMVALLVAFAALSYREMTGHPVLRAWLAVVVAGAALTAAGAAALIAGGPAAVVEATVIGWALVPAVALAYTGRRLPAEEWAGVYTAGGVASGLGAAALLLDAVGPDLTLLGLVLAGAGQTAGIAAAVLRY